MKINSYLFHLRKPLKILAFLVSALRHLLVLSTVICDKMHAVTLGIWGIN